MVTVTVLVMPPDMTLNRLAAVSMLVTLPVSVVACPMPGVGVGVGRRGVGVAVGEASGVEVAVGVVLGVVVPGVPVVFPLAEMFVVVCV